ncbi:succinate dehydrogenase hydrophobic anchor subunit [Chryseobacterium sp. H1D6B]|uniref:hypothetical protein n=1 Tax=Chryseobacterium sp. H1D6B TaxID=2940588 RepID=UPI0015CB2204|nr:hypothetical protein [Chryseobacterium sp. H1D6B]MDH6252384.1 succinate dehydrogenase hydrophobic anchor subunit [Chryseobacterium sp. H1D6B]
MKKITGIAIILLILTFLSVIVLRIWNIEIVSIKNLLKSSATLIFLGLAIVIFIIVYGIFLRDNDQEYHKKKGNKAHPKL